MIDLHACSHGSIVTLQPETEAGAGWLHGNVGATVCERRYAEDILYGAHSDGLTVAFDGREIAHTEPC